MDNSVLRDDMVDGLEHSLESLPEAVSIAMRSVPDTSSSASSAFRPPVRTPRHARPRPVPPAGCSKPCHPRKTTVLVVGAGVGYTAAVLADGRRANVHAIDITRRLVSSAPNRQTPAMTPSSWTVVTALTDSRRRTVRRILLEAAASDPARALLQQLTDDGRLVMPLGTGEQSLAVVEADGSVKRHGTVASSRCSSRANRLIPSAQPDSP
ncbi:protein-L-isoaspartate O-methyltransferase [Haloferax sp. wsp5]|nr:protein-L-isoaspartate O-methyltransferase [Haloferax sp. wsp5]